MIIACLSLVPACGGKDGDSGAKSTKSAKKGKKGKKGKKSKYNGLDTVPNAGSISGTISYAGDAKDAAVTVTKDNETCDPAGKAPEGAVIVTDGKVKNAVVYLDGVKEGKKFDKGTLLVDNVACVFTPRVSVAHVGDQLDAKNSDPVLHNTHLFLKKGNKNLFNIALPQKDQIITKKLKKSGLVDVRCDAHEWMQAWVYVSTHPYVALTGADGSFSMSDVPAGDYTAKIWHEKLGEKDAKVSVTAGGDAKVEVSL